MMSLSVHAFIAGLALGLGKDKSATTDLFIGKNTTSNTPSCS